MDQDRRPRDDLIVALIGGGSLLVTLIFGVLLLINLWRYRLIERLLNQLCGL